MTRKLIVVLALACFCTLGISAAFAGGPGCSGAKKAKAEGCTKTCSADSGDFPKIAMMVNGKSYDCCTAAAKAATEAKAKIVYMVGEQKFDDKAKATEALADEGERFVDRFTTIACVADGKMMYCSDTGEYSKGAAAKAEGATCHKSGATAAKSEGATKAKSEGATCHKTDATAAKHDGGTRPKTGATAAKSEDSGCKGAMAKADGCCKGGAKMTKEQIEACCKNAKEVKFMVMGRTFSKRDDAAKAREEAMGAMKNVKMTYLVGGKEMDSSTKLCPMAKKEGKIAYMVNKEKLSCEFEARVALAKAKYDAARSYAEKLAKI